ncbi:MAG TPA: nucleotidyltransferase family protein [Acidobacteriota bacterium]|jgi:hypothetical protein|nr:nucleotidyltransferase family protein [Acidobacteriota bacterium]HNR39427.1 nucleotidyltransferase family protein [Acidobacteriota bacterium]HNU00823.1 nucleotidyltransferase family protein [Acidobacteriota bacterium]HPB26918.1 nucleotidyltransferase family protein [Acidobacteriota bacterium]HQO24757.1 nucleotidyltransferase family protein [Acidobacteriota bacterium]
MDDPVYLFLSRFARVACDAERRRELRDAARDFSARMPEWAGVAEQAEAQGMAPLLLHLLRQAGGAPPPRVERVLQGLALQHRAANAARFGALREALDSLAGAGIPVLMLKGAALAHLVYPEPGLRPMGDLDLLVPPDVLAPALETLRGLGYRDLPPNPGALWQAEHRHSPPVRRIAGGTPVVIELHMDLFAQSGERSPDTGNVWADPRPVPLPGGADVRTLGHEAMLLHLCWHLVNIRHLADQVIRPRLIWIADIVSYAEGYAEDIDWAALCARRPFIRSTLALLHQLIPLSAGLRDRLGVREAGRRPRGVGEGYRGWPTRPLASPDRDRLSLFLWDTFHPPEWWLRLHYGLGPEGSLLWTRWFRHPGRIVGGVAHKLIRQYRYSPAR